MKSVTINVSFTAEVPDGTNIENIIVNLPSHQVEIMERTTTKKHPLFVIVDGAQVSEYETLEAFENAKVS